MSNNGERTKGLGQEALGTVKEGVGKVIGNEQMEAEGKAKKLEGEARQEAAKAAERTKGGLQEVGGSIKEGVGKLIDNEQMEAEGKAKKLEGEARQKAAK